MNKVCCTWQDIKDDINADNAKSYADTIDKLAFCSDLTGLSVDSRMIVRFENELETLAKQLGFLS